MRRIYSALCLWNLAFLAGTSVLGLLPAGSLPAGAHRMAGVFVAFFGCLVPSILIAHFIGSMKWIQQTGRSAGIEDTRALRTAWVKGPMFPSLLVAAGLAAAGAVTGRWTAGGDAGRTVHLAVAALGIPAVLVSWRFALRGIDESRDRMRAIAAEAATRQVRGEVREAPVETLLEESGRAGGKALVFLSLQVWFLYAYVVWVLKHDTPVWAYAGASAVLLLLGLWMLRSGAGAAQTPRAGEGTTAGR